MYVHSLFILQVATPLLRIKLARNSTSSSTLSDQYGARCTRRKISSHNKRSDVPRATMDFLFGRRTYSHRSRRHDDDWREKLERCCRWLSSIPNDEAQAMQHSRAYRDFLAAFECLEQEHRQHAHFHNNMMLLDDMSFLQRIASDDIIQRVFEFLECQSLVKVMRCCVRFRDLAEQNARRRALLFTTQRQLSHPMHLLRACEQMDGLSPNAPHVRIPTLLLRRRVVVSNCGDEEFNGIYYCTGSNGNGFVFTKPRGDHHRLPDDGTRPVDFDDDALDSPCLTQALRCIIAKRFSNETILWYMSKEVLSEDGSEFNQVFCFWSKLMVVGDAAADVCRYPSQSSILARHDEGWQTLSTTRMIAPPIVELLD